MRTRAVRLAEHRAVSTALAALDDRGLSTLLDEARPAGVTIGGSATVLDIAGTPVFAKRVALTDREREHWMSTANIFDLPVVYQYRVGSAGFGVWRELAVHAMTTTWVTDGACESFPLMYGWRVVDGPPQTCGPDERERQIAFWADSAVRERLEAISRASASVVLFLEYIPHTLHAWLTAQVAAGDAAVEAACAMVVREARGVVEFMRAHDLLHMDPHAWNVLTDGDRLYLADFGLATSRRFALSESEVEFFERHASYDGCVMLTELVNWLELTYRTAMPAFATAIVERHASIARALNVFYRRLREDRGTPYPDELRHALIAG